MNRLQIFLHGFTKHFLVFGSLLALHFWWMKSVVSEFSPPPACVPLFKETPPDPISLLLTVAGLLLAGAISGYFQFSYDNVNQVSKDRLSIPHMLLGDLATGLHLLVIGVLLLFSVECLDMVPETQRLSPGPFYVSLALYTGLVVYDVFDLLRLTSRKNFGTTTEEA